MVIDATELGDLLPLVGAEYVVGAETIAETGEPHAQPVERKPSACRALPMCSGSSAVPGRAPRHRAPARYDYFRAAQPYSLRIEVHGGEIYGEESGWLDTICTTRCPARREGYGPIAA